MLTQRRFLLAALAALAVLGGTATARATSVDVLATPFAGSDISVRIFLDDAGGDIAVRLEVEDGISDLRGFFLNISDFSLLDGLKVTGDDVTGFEVAERGVIDVGQGANLHGGGSPCPCDLGVEIGTPGTGKDDFLSTSFVLDADATLTVQDFANELAGVRVTSVATLDDIKDDVKEGDRRGSAKLAATIPEATPIPEPATALLTAFGLGTLAYVSRSRR